MLPRSKQRLYAGLIFLGAGVLLFRTLRLVFTGALSILVPWVSVLLFVEMLLDLTCMVFATRWWIAGDASKDRIPLRLGAAAAILHAVRVLWYSYWAAPGRGLILTYGLSIEPCIIPDGK